ncbi:hypothetical protein [Rhodococcus sp. NPDC127528]|uniref:hypothetical protein n=1 Tax=unclassified Rhodococcus (in: high G+C Gram-positive bacteria) TaxID=192944 RepID=UPI003624F165
MTDDDHLWFYCISDGSVRQGKEARGVDRMGPYPDRATAARALEIAAERNKAADKADDDWNN